MVQPLLEVNRLLIEPRHPLHFVAGNDGLFAHVVTTTKSNISLHLLHAIQIAVAPRLKIFFLSTVELSHDAR
jgi:hypothetical protein